MNNSIFSKLTPKEPKFFPILNSLADVALRSSHELIECVQNNNPTIHQKIKDLEHEGDKIIANVYYELNTTFIVPFDREDINSLANSLDDVVDEIYGCAKRITFYKPKRMPSEALDLAKMVEEGAGAMFKAISYLSSLKKHSSDIQKYCDEMHKIESAADEVFQNFMIELFENNTDAIEIIKLKEIINILESITDSIDHVGKVIKTIIVKYS